MHAACRTLMMQHFVSAVFLSYQFDLELYDTQQTINYAGFKFNMHTYRLACGKHSVSANIESLSNVAPSQRHGRNIARTTKQLLWTGHTFINHECMYIHIYIFYNPLHDKFIRSQLGPQTQTAPIQLNPSPLMCSCSCLSKFAAPVVLC